MKSDRKTKTSQNSNVAAVVSSPRIEYEGHLGTYALVKGCQCLSVCECAGAVSRVKRAEYDNRIVEHLKKTVTDKEKAIYIAKYGSQLLADNIHLVEELKKAGFKNIHLILIDKINSGNINIEVKDYPQEMSLRSLLPGALQEFGREMNNRGVTCQVNICNAVVNDNVNNNLKKASHDYTNANDIYASSHHAGDTHASARATHATYAGEANLELHMFDVLGNVPAGLKKKINAFMAIDVWPPTTLDEIVVKGYLTGLNRHAMCISCIKPQPTLDQLKNSLTDDLFEKNLKQTEAKKIKHLWKEFVTDFGHQIISSRFNEKIVEECLQQFLTLFNEQSLHDVFEKAIYLLPVVAHKEVVGELNYQMPSKIDDIRENRHFVRVKAGLKAACTEFETYHESIIQNQSTIDYSEFNRNYADILLTLGKMRIREGDPYSELFDLVLNGQPLINKNIEELNRRSVVVMEYFRKVMEVINCIPPERRTIEDEHHFSDAVIWLSHALEMYRFIYNVAEGKVVIPTTGNIKISDIPYFSAGNHQEFHQTKDGKHSHIRREVNKSYFSKKTYKLEDLYTLFDSMIVNSVANYNLNLSYRRLKPNNIFTILSHLQSQPNNSAELNTEIRRMQHELTEKHYIRHFLTALLKAWYQNPSLENSFRKMYDLASDLSVTLLQCENILNDEEKKNDVQALADLANKLNGLIGNRALLLFDGEINTITARIMKQISELQNNSHPSGSKRTNFFKPPLIRKGEKNENGNKTKKIKTTHGRDNKHM